MDNGEPWVFVHIKFAFWRGPWGCGVEDGASCGGLRGGRSPQPSESVLFRERHTHPQAPCAPLSTCHFKNEAFLPFHTGPSVWPGLCPISTGWLSAPPAPGWGLIMHVLLCFIVQICVCDVVGLISKENCVA